MYTTWICTELARSWRWRAEALEASAGDRACDAKTDPGPVVTTEGGYSPSHLEIFGAVSAGQRRTCSPWNFCGWPTLSPRRRPVKERLLFSKRFDCGPAPLRFGKWFISRGTVYSVTCARKPSQSTPWCFKPRTMWRARFDVGVIWRLPSHKLRRWPPALLYLPQPFPLLCGRHTSNWFGLQLPTLLSTYILRMMVHASKTLPPTIPQNPEVTDTNLRCASFPKAPFEVVELCRPCGDPGVFALSLFYPGLQPMDVYVSQATQAHGRTWTHESIYLNVEDSLPQPTSIATFIASKWASAYESSTRGTVTRYVKNFKAAAIVNASAFNVILLLLLLERYSYIRGFGHKSVLNDRPSFRIS
ncbi:predicted protein [Postia placenta Mad-698-R]|nr:predicted protein [Postia placenta Mad-698-R]